MSAQGAEFDVAIVGFGPVGALSAVLLAEAGLEVAVVERSREPVVLPAAFPNLLANGAQGIAVGMATNIPPHNADELCAALLQLIKKRSTTVEELLELAPGPDFPTGGVIAEAPETIVAAYRTGRGSLRLRAR